MNTIANRSESKSAINVKTYKRKTKFKRKNFNQSEGTDSGLLGKTKQKKERKSITCCQTHLLSLV